MPTATETVIFIRFGEEMFIIYIYIYVVHPISHNYYSSRNFIRTATKKFWALLMNEKNVHQINE